MINYKKGLKFIFIFIIAIFLVYFLFFKIKNFDLINKKKPKPDISKQYSPDDKVKEVVVYYGDSNSDRLKSAVVKIYSDNYIINEVKQILEKLFENPPPGYTRVVPEGTSIREVFIDSNATLYIDLSQEFMLNNKGGTTFEYLSIYSIIKSIFKNFKEIRGIKFLINGTEQETVSGHISIIDIFRYEDADL